jgi:hypothetical protein
LTRRTPTGAGPLCDLCGGRFSVTSAVVDSASKTFHTEITEKKIKPQILTEEI